MTESSVGITITTINVNGIRAAVKERSEDNHGFLGWLASTATPPDVLLLQEMRATQQQAEQALAPLLDGPWSLYHAPSINKGRAGVALLVKEPWAVHDVERGFGSFQESGRWISATMTRNPEEEVTVASLYMPSGEAGTEKQVEKYHFLEEFSDVLTTAAHENEHMVIGGDWNICHRRQDLKNWKTNQKRAGFLPDERAFMDSVFGSFPEEKSQREEGVSLLYECTDHPLWCDVVRRLYPDPEECGPYSWWSYRGKAFDTNAGWRIDYQAATMPMMERARRVVVDKPSAYALRWSDHAPVTVCYEWPSKSVHC